LVISFLPGEFVGKDFQGYMNGHAETSRVAVKLMIHKVNPSSNETDRFYAYD
jgi:hypothetical protein